MRIIRVAQRLPPCPGGKEVHVRELTLNQVQVGEKVTVLFSNGEPIPGVPCFRLSGTASRTMPSEKWSSVRFGLRAGFRLVRMKRPDVVHLHGDYLDLFPVGLVCLLKRVPLVVTVHGGLNMQHRLFARLSFLLAGRVIALGPSPWRQVQELGVPRRHLFAATSGLRTSDLDKAAREVRERPAGAATRVVCVGSLIEIKNVALVIEAVQRIAGMTLTVIGGGPERERLEGLVKDAGSVRFTGALEATRAFGEMANSDIFVSASVPSIGKSEGVSTALLEAMYLGTACVVSRQSDPSLGTKNPAYLTFDGEDCESLVAALQHLQRDDTYRRALGARGKAAVSSRTWPAVSAQVTSVLVDATRRTSGCVSDGSELRVLEVIKTLQVGGAERLLVSRLKAQATLPVDRGVVTDLIVLTDGSPALIDEVRPAVHSLNVFRSGGVVNLRWLAFVRRLLRHRHIDVVHVHSPIAAVALRLMLLARRHPKLVVTEHSEKYRRVTRLLNRATYRFTDYVVAVSRAVEASLPIASVPVKVITHGTDLRAAIQWVGVRDETRNALGWTDEAQIVVTVANLRPAKDLANLLRAAVVVHAQRPKVRFVVVGEGSLRRELEALRDRLGLGEVVTFPGLVDNALRLIAAADVFCLSSSHEGLPVAVMEALACGTPAVCTDVGGIRELVQDGHSGLLVEARRPDKLAEALLSLLGDEDRRLAMAQRAYETGRTLDIHHAAMQMRQVFCDVTDKS